MATFTDSKPSPASSQPLSTSAAPTQAPSNVADSRYTFDDAKLEELRKQSPWKNDPKYFKQVSVSPHGHCENGEIVNFAIIRCLFGLYSWVELTLRCIILLYPYMNIHINR